MRTFLLLLLLVQADDRADFKAARAALKRGDYGEAEKLLKRLSFDNRDAWVYRRLHADALLATGRTADAEKLLREYLASHDTSAPAKAALARVLLEQDKPAAALDAAPGDDVRCRAARALALDALGRPDDALALTGAILEEYKKQKNAWMREEIEAVARAAELHARLAADLEVNRLVLRTLIPDLVYSDPNDAELKSWQARINLDKGNPADSVALVEAALAANPKCASALVCQARLILAQGRGPQAIQQLDAALAVNPAHLDAHLLKIRLLDGAKADEALAKALERRPDSVRLWAVKGAFATLKGDAAAAADARKRIPAGSPIADLEAGRLLLHGGQIRIEEAHACFQRAFETAPKLVETKLEFALSCLRTGNEKEARRLLDEIRTKDATNKRAADAYDLLHDFESQTETAVKHGVTVRLPRNHAWLADLAGRVAATASRSATKWFGGEPGPLSVDILEKHEDLAARAGGAPLTAGGVCLGPRVAILAPLPRPGNDAYLWCAELAGVVARGHVAHASKGRAPRWLLDGAALLAAAPWDRDRDWHAIRLRETRVDGGAPRAVALYLEFLGVEKTPAFIAAFASKTPDIDDKGFTAWLEQRAAGVKVALPPKEDAGKLAEAADADPSKAIAASRAWLARGDADKALKYAKLARKHDEKSAEARALIGQALVKKRGAEEAHEHLVEATKGGIDEYRTWMALGIAEAELEELGKAAEAFERATKCLVLVSDPEGENALRRLLEIATRKKDEEAQARVLARLAAADPYATRERVRFARLLLARQAWEEAVTVLSAAVVIHPRGKEEWDLLSQALEGEKKIEAAIDARQSALSLIEINALADPERARADELVEIGRLWLKQGDKEKARQAAKRALTESPGHEAAQKLYDEALKE